MPLFNFKVYVACSLTHATQEFRNMIEVFKKNLDPICHVLRFVDFDKKASADEIYRWDIEECVNKSDLVVAVCDLPSIGLGWEMGAQVESRGMPCLALAHTESKVTAFVPGCNKQCFSFRRYNNLLADGFYFVVDKLRQMQEAEAHRHPLLKLIGVPGHGQAASVAAL